MGEQTRTMTVQTGTAQQEDRATGVRVNRIVYPSPNRLGL